MLAGWNAWRRGPQRAGRVRRGLDLDGKTIKRLLRWQGGKWLFEHVTTEINVPVLWWAAAAAGAGRGGDMLTTYERPPTVHAPGAAAPDHPAAGGGGVARRRCRGPGGLGMVRVLMTTDQILKGVSAAAAHLCSDDRLCMTTWSKHSGEQVQIDLLERFLGALTVSLRDDLLAEEAKKNGTSVQKKALERIAKNRSPVKKGFMCGTFRTKDGNRRSAMGSGLCGSQTPLLLCQRMRQEFQMTH